jgi:uncharacterized protein (TIGR03435 family)
MNRSLVCLDGVNTTYFDVEGTTEGGSGPIPREKLKPMLQALLHDRFQLKAHSEKRDLPVYNLVVAKEKPKLKLSEDQTPADAPLRGTIQAMPNVATRRFVLRGTAVPLSALTHFLVLYTRRPLFDETHVNGLYDIHFEFNPDLSLTAGPADVSSPVSTGSSIFTALQEQLGLKLESAKGPVEVLVIDSVSKPTEN